MGDRVSISFRNGDQESVTLFNQWGGAQFPVDAQEYADTLLRRRLTTPLERREPNTVMVDFIRHITKNLVKVDGDLYLGADPSCGDNSDNGHFIIKLGLGKG